VNGDYDNLTVYGFQKYFLAYDSFNFSVGAGLTSLLFNIYCTMTEMHRSAGSRGASGFRTRKSAANLVEMMVLEPTMGACRC